MRWVALLMCLVASGASAQVPATSLPSSSEYVVARTREAELNGLLRRVLQGEELSLNKDIGPNAIIAIESLGSEPSNRIEPLTASNLRAWIGECNQLGQIAVTKASGPYQIYFAYQCATEKMSGDVRAVFAFEHDLLTEVRLNRVIYVPSRGDASAPAQQPGTTEIYDPMKTFFNEHQGRIAAIDALLDAMQRRDEKAFRAARGNEIAFSSDPEMIVSAMMAPGASRLTLDSLASLRSCKAGRPLAAPGNLFTVAWECPVDGRDAASQFSFRFAGRNLVAVQALPGPRKVKI